MTTWVYIRSEPGIWTVGFYDPSGRWHAESDCDTSTEAAARVHWLNGGKTISISGAAPGIPAADPTAAGPLSSAAPTSPRAASGSVLGRFCFWHKPERPAQEPSPVMLREKGSYLYWTLRNKWVHDDARTRALNARQAEVQRIGAASQGK